jgi:sugar/nucleoside kinase (ribokinase family)
VVPRFPKPEEKIRAIHAEECAGGTVATALVALQRWGLNARLLSVVGLDRYSDRILEDLHEECIDTSRILRMPDAEARRSTVLVDNRNGQRCVISGPHRHPQLVPEMLDAQLFAGARILHVDTTVDECAVEAATMAKAAGLRVTVDAERVCPGVDKLLPLCEYVIASAAFAREWTGQDKLSLAAYGVHLKSGRPTIVTDGGDGCEYAAEDVQFHQSAFDVPVVDGTGAGDVFHAAFIYGLLATWEIRRTIRFASWAAGHACRELGGRKGIPTPDAIREYLQNDH